MRTAECGSQAVMAVKQRDNKQRVDRTVSTMESKPKVLAVDDDPININILMDLLQDEYQVLAAVNGTTGLQAASRTNPDVILLDITMPDMSGHEVLKQLKADPLTKDIPVIFITGLSDAEDEARGLELGASDYVSKPFNPTVTKARIKTQLRLKQQADQLAAYAFMDGLTGIPNRRAFDEKAAEGFDRCARYQMDFGLILLDVDYFKLYNDHYGHTQGDDCLKAVARAVAAGVSVDEGFAARYGGEEFVVVLPGVAGPRCEALAQSLLAKIWETNIEHTASPDAGRVTISLGVAVGLPSGSSTLEHVLKRADEALYESKAGGRNCVSLKRL